VKPLKSDALSVSSNLLVSMVLPPVTKFSEEKYLLTNSQEEVAQ
jgi:hypothetical protein